MKLVGPVLAGIFLAGLAAAGAAVAQPQGSPGGPPDWHQRPDAAREAVRERRLTPLSRVIEEIHRRTPGRQLDANLEQQDGRQVYRVRWMTSDGRRIDYIVDAVSGAILKGG